VIPHRSGLSVPRGAVAAVIGLAVVTAVAAILRGGMELRHVPEILTLVAFYALVIAIGEYYRFRFEDSRDLAPMSLAAALALVLLSRSGTHDLVGLQPSPLLAAVALGLTLGALPRLLLGQDVRVDEVSARFLGVTVTAVVYRKLPLWDGQTLLQVDAGWHGDRWPMAILLSLAAAAGLAAFLFLTALTRAARLHQGLRQAVADELRAGAGLGLALSSSGTLVALAARPLGLAALPLFLIPLVLTQFALRQYAAIRRTYAQTVRVLSRLTELGGFTRPGHPDRVCQLSIELGRDLSVPERELRYLEHAALLHDLGQVALRSPIPAGATVMAAPADQRRIAEAGAQIVREAGVAAEVGDAVAAQATPYRVVREFDEELPLLARILKVANAYDDFVGGSITARRREAAMERIHLGLGYEYDPRVVDSLQRVLERRHTHRH